MNETRGKLAFSLNEQIKENEMQRRQLLAENAELLNEIFDKKYYKELLGDEQGEWAGYLADLEIYYSRNQANTYMRIWKKMSELELTIEDWVSLPVTRLSESLSFLTKENYEDWFSRISTLLSSDWKKELLLAQGKEVDKEHEHQMVQYNICKVCGEKHKA